MIAPTVFISTFPSEATLGRNLSVTCTTTTGYGLETGVAVIPHIVWEVTYEVDGAVVINPSEATDLINSSSNTFLSELKYSPILVAMNFTCRSYLNFSIPSEVVIDSDFAEYTRKVIPQGTSNYYFMLYPG